MPDSAEKNVPPSVSSASPSRTQARRTGDAPATSVTETDKKLARAARSAQRLAQLPSAPAGDTTLDLFAEDTERATFQARNTDIRQGTLAGFELPKVFMAAVQSTAVSGEAGSGKRAGRTVTGAVVQAADAAASLIDDNTSEAAESKRGKAVSTARVVSGTSAAAAKRVQSTAPHAASGPRDVAQLRDGVESSN